MAQPTQPPTVPEPLSADQLADAFLIAAAAARTGSVAAVLDAVRAAVPHVFDEKPTTGTQATHQHVAGWAGGPGGCGVECACGVTYDGFDTIGEASELLDQHIVDVATVASDRLDERTPVDVLGELLLALPPAELLAAMAELRRPPTRDERAQADHDLRTLIAPTLPPAQRRRLLDLLDRYGVKQTPCKPWCSSAQPCGGECVAKGVTVAATAGVSMLLDHGILYPRVEAYAAVGDDGQVSVDVSIHGPINDRENREAWASMTPAEARRFAVALLAQVDLAEGVA